MSMTIGFSLLPSTGSSGNSSCKKSLLHCQHHASVIVGDVQMGIQKVRGCIKGGGIGRGQFEVGEEVDVPEE